MKVFLKRLALFFLPFLLGSLALFVLPFDPSFAFHSLNQHCRNGHWQYYRLYEDPTPIDIAFLGTSQTLCGVSDYVLEQQLDSLTETSPKVANLGFCRPGRTLHYALTKVLLEKHPPKLLILELRVKEDRFSHLNFPYIARSRDLWLAEPDLHQRYFGDLGTAGKMRFLYWKNRLLGEGWEFDSLEYGRSHGFIPSGSSVYMDSTVALADYPLQFAPTEGIAAFDYQLKNRFPLQYVRKIADLCAEKGVKLVFLYLPRLRDDPAQWPMARDYFETIAPIWKPPAEWYRPVRNWMDPEHMNEEGAFKLTSWLTEKIISESGFFPAASN